MARKYRIVSACQTRQDIMGTLVEEGYSLEILRFGFLWDPLFVDGRPSWFRSLAEAKEAKRVLSNKGREVFE